SSSTQKGWKSLETQEICYSGGSTGKPLITDRNRMRRSMERFSDPDSSMAMSVIGDRRSREQKAKQEREKELAKVTIKKEDVELIMSEMEISRAMAERSLREHMGNVVEALVALTN
uniref:Huntingtin interacting protein K n=1 Tax=Amphilophus citrinellus TaxID=61819 RepID=A0A3Q0SAQ2_AMPCI